MTAVQTTADLPRPSLAGWFLLLPVRLYRAITVGRPSPCRFDPSCSSFALEAISRYGALKGGWLTLRRLARCHPWGGQGWDPVPPRIPRKVNDV